MDDDGLKTRDRNWPSAEPCLLIGPGPNVFVSAAGAAAAVPDCQLIVRYSRPLFCSSFCAAH